MPKFHLLTIDKIRVTSQALNFSFCSSSTAPSISWNMLSIYSAITQNTLYQTHLPSSSFSPPTYRISFIFQFRGIYLSNKIKTLESNLFFSLTSALHPFSQTFNVISSILRVSQPTVFLFHYFFL